MSLALQQTFSSLRVRNFRLYLTAQAISMTGTFLQMLAQDWLVLKLTNSGVMLGLVAATQFTPMLIFALWGGLIADRFPKLRLLFFTHSTAALIALLVGILVLTGLIQIWMVFVCALLLGLSNSIDNPTRQSFIYEMVGPGEVKNAVSLWTIVISVSRIAGPALAGVLIALVGIGVCFVLNAFSYGAVLIALSLMRPGELTASPRASNDKGQIRAGLRYAAAHPLIRRALIMLAIIGTLTYEWPTSLPLFTKFTLHGDAATYAAISVSMSVGMLIAGFIGARSAQVSQRRMILGAFLIGVFVILASFVHALPIAIVVFVGIGAANITFANLINATLQLNAEPSMRGRVMSLWNVAFQGSTAIGAPIIGWVGSTYGAPSALLVGGIAALAAAAYGFTSLRSENS